MQQVSIRLFRLWRKLIFRHIRVLKIIRFPELSPGGSYLKVGAKIRAKVRLRGRSWPLGLLLQ